MAAIAVTMFQSICVLSNRIWHGGNMRVSWVVNNAKYCWRNVIMNSAPQTTNIATVRPSFHFQSEPTNVSTRVRDSPAPVLPIKPTQSSPFNFRSIEISLAPFGVTGGR